MQKTITIHFLRHEITLQFIINWKKITLSNKYNNQNTPSKSTANQSQRPYLSHLIHVIFLLQYTMS